MGLRNTGRVAFYLIAALEHENHKSQLILRRKPHVNGPDHSCQCWNFYFNQSDISSASQSVLVAIYRFYRFESRPIRIHWILSTSPCTEKNWCKAGSGIQVNISHWVRIYTYVFTLIAPSFKLRYK